MGAADVRVNEGSETRVYSVLAMAAARTGAAGESDMHGIMM